MDAAPIWGTLQRNQPAFGGLAPRNIVALRFQGLNGFGKSADPAHASGEAWRGGVTAA